MIYSYLKAVIRLLYRKSFYQLLNVTALTIGLAVAGIVVLFAWHEYGYDRFHPNANSIYRLSGKANGDVWFAPFSAAYSNALRNDKFGVVEKVVRVRRNPAKYIRYGDKKFYESRVVITDSQTDFFDMFNFKAVHGDLQQALTEPNSVVLAKSVSKKIFGDLPPLGEAIYFDTLQLKVTAVIEDLPTSTHFDFTVLIANDREMANASAIYTYVQLHPETDKGQLKKSLLSMEVKQIDKLTDIQIIPLQQLHFENGLTFEMKSVVSKNYLFIFLTIGLLVLLLSCVNYMNLAMSLYAQRAKEIAVRKIVGAHRLHLSFQFLLETMCISLLCVPGILLFLHFLLPAFNSFMGIRIENLFIQHPLFFLTLLCLALLVGLLSGLYPAWLMPKINAITLFKNGFSGTNRGWGLRTASVTFQMTVMVLMISTSVAINGQLNFIQEKDLGFEHEGVIKIGGAWRVDSTQYNNLKSELLVHPTVMSVSQGYAPGDEDFGFSYRKEGSSTVFNDLIAFNTDIEYLKTMEIKVLESEFGTALDSLPSRMILINETLAKKLEFKNPIGEKIILNPGTENERIRTVRGVFKDFHYFSLHEPITPMMLTFRPFGSGINQNILVRIAPGDMKAAMKYVTQKANEIVPNIPLSPEFLDEDLQKRYERETKLATFCTVLLVIAVILSIVGLVGLASHAVTTKTKEIGIRKVLGADVAIIISLVAKPFLKLSALSFVIGSALSAYLAYQWLQSFAYKADLSWQLHSVSLIVLAFVLLVTIGGHAFLAANANPAKSLRSE
jgi:putative ABC transport system permease protein